MSGSRGEANFVWKCKSCKVCWLFVYFLSITHEDAKREHSATIVDSVSSYVQGSPPTEQQIMRLDCRGLEFVEFKPDVC